MWKEIRENKTEPIAPQLYKLKYTLPGESESIFKTLPCTKANWESVRKPDGSWYKRKTEPLHVGNYLIVRFGSEGILKLLNEDPFFLFELITMCGPDFVEWRLQRVDLSINCNHEIVKRFSAGIKKKHYDSFGKHVNAIVPNYWKHKKQLDPGNNIKVASVPVGRASGEREYMRDEDWNNISSLYVGNFNKSTVTAVIYAKQDESFDRKSRSNDLASRTEMRFFVKKILKRNRFF
jgi:hypothetical protein